MTKMNVILTGDDNRTEGHQTSTANSRKESSSDELVHVVRGACDDIAENEYPNLSYKHALCAEDFLCTKRDTMRRL